MNEKLNVLTKPLLHIVLDRPRIAANIASIVRLSTATQCALHVCGPLVFDSSDKTKWRAGLDYFYGARVHFHHNIHRCLSLLQKKPWIIEVGSSKAPWDVSIHQSDVIILGPETSSVDETLLTQFADRILTLPQTGPVRSLNLAQCAAVATFEAMRQISSLKPEQRHLQEKA